MGNGASILILAVVLAAGCDEAQSILARIGFADNPPAPAELVDVVCDASAGSTCTERNLNEALGVILQWAAERPDSVVRLWALGTTHATTSLVCSRLFDRSPRPGAKPERKHRERLVAETRSQFEGAIASHLALPAKQRSPIAEGLSKVALDRGQGGLPRRIILITDAREVSMTIGDLECKRLPSKEVFLRRLRTLHVLGPGQLDGARVHFSYVTRGPVADNRCEVSVARDVRLQELWTAALNAAGAKEVEYTAGIPDLRTKPLTVSLRSP